MNTLHTIDTDYELTWDELVITVEDLHLIETGADLAENNYATVLAAFERGIEDARQCLVIARLTIAPSRLKTRPC
jgi:UDP-N-acetylglucosamine transferase subunit ALG13